jgi:predicted amidophosphoribosyltransferase
MHGCGLFAPNLLQRQKATTSQAGLNHAQRKQNLARAFQLNESGKAAVRDHHILLIDDVLTTGATLNEAAQTLTRAGCKSVGALVIARVT